MEKFDPSSSLVTIKTISNFVSGLEILRTHVTSWAKEPIGILKFLPDLEYAENYPILVERMAVIITHHSVSGERQGFFFGLIGAAIPGFLQGLEIIRGFSHAFK